MTIRFLVIATSCNVLPTGPTSADLARAYRAVRTGGSWGNWIGPAPRIVRTRGAGADCLYKVESSWLFEAPIADASDEQSLRTMMYRALVGASDEIANKGDLVWSMQPYDPQIHGLLTFWSSGEASRTDTRDEWRSVVDTRPNDNPVGPNSALPQAPTTGQIGRDALKFFTDNATPIVVGAAVIVTMVYVGPVIRRAFSGESALPAKKPHPSSRTNVIRRAFSGESALPPEYGPREAFYNRRRIF